MAESWKIIANPIAGGGRWFAKKKRIESHFRNSGLKFSWHFPQGFSEQARLIEELLAQGHRQFISAGGDGTLHHIVNSFMRQSIVPMQEILLAVLPLGTGNDWIKTHKIPKNTRKAIEIIAAANHKAQDIGLIKYQDGDQQVERFFCNVAGTGFEAAVVKESLSLKKGGLKGTFLYLALVLRTLWTYVSLSHSVNAQPAQPMLLTTIGLCRFNGGGMKLVPKADPFDGQFDVTSIGDLSRGEVIRNLAKLYNGKIYTHPKVAFERLSELSIDGPTPVPIEADGEFLGHSPASFHLLPARVRFIVP
ncbi:MAG: diacylglycerol kinase family protein [Bacteroidota bacterium]